MLRSFHRDRRGLILVVAIPMAAIMAGTLWYLATVGDAVLFRERLQDAADATAFENAVLHARGMNAIALLNMLMALFLSIIVAIRAAELILAAGLIFFGATAGPLAQVVNFDLQWSDRIGKVVAVISKIEKGVAAATPVLSTVMTTTENTSFYRDQEAASATTSFSYALLPSRVDKFMRVNPRNRSQLALGRNNSSTPRLAAALTSGSGGEFLPSLPLEEDTFDEMCSQAIQFGGKQVTGLAERMGIPGGVTWGIEKGMDLIADALAEYLSGLFCGSAQGAVMSLISDAASSVCEGGLPEGAQQQPQQQDPQQPQAQQPQGQQPQAQQPQTQQPQGQQAPKEPPPPASVTSTPKPKKPGRGDAASCKQQVEQQLKKSASNPDEQRPAKVWTPVTNGNVLMQTWAVAVTSGPKFRELDERGMNITAEGDDFKLRPNLTAWAEAEYYFDCKAQPRAAAQWSNCKHDAMWALGWTARMRRFWWPLAELERAGNAFNRFEGVLVAVDNLLRRGVADFTGNGTKDLAQGANTALSTKQVFDAMSRPAPEWIH
jgi:hypothetical protein